MAVTAIWTWRFESDGDTRKAMRAAVPGSLKTSRQRSTESSFLCWLRHVKETLRYRHLVACDSFESMERVRLSQSVRRFFEELNPEVEVDTIERRHLEVALS